METITLQSTGRRPVCFTGRTLVQSEDAPLNDKRSVRVTLLEEGEGQAIWCELAYLTKWPGERGHVLTKRVTMPMPTDDERAKAVDKICDWVHAKAAQVMPKGAGYPVGDQFTARQEKLVAQMQLLVLTCLSNCLQHLAYQKV